MNSPMRERADSIDSSSALLHGRWRPGDAVVDYAAAEGVQILALLQHVRRGKNERKPRHAELPHEPLVDTPRHPAHGNLAL